MYRTWHEQMIIYISTQVLSFCYPSFCHSNIHKDKISCYDKTALVTTAYHTASTNPVGYILVIEITAIDQSNPMLIHTHTRTCVCVRPAPLSSHTQLSFVYHQSNREWLIVTYRVLYLQTLAGTFTSDILTFLTTFTPWKWPTSTCQSPYDQSIINHISSDISHPTNIPISYRYDVHLWCKYTRFISQHWIFGWQMELNVEWSIKWNDPWGHKYLWGHKNFNCPDPWVVDWKFSLLRQLQ